MAALIDLSVVKSISFGRKDLMMDLLEEWIMDTNDLIRTMLSEIDQNKVEFQTKHKLKTNFCMIGSSSGIQLCEQLIHRDGGYKKIMEEIEKVFQSTIQEIQKLKSEL